MKVAWCLYGQPRLLVQGYKNIINFVNKYPDVEFDFFFHTWFDPALVNQYYTSSNFRYINKDDLLIKKDLMEKAIDLYHPKNYKYESPIKFEVANILQSNICKYDLHANHNSETNISNCISNLYSKYQTYCILQEYIENTKSNYDLVISCRFDFLNDITLNLYDVDVNKISSKFTGRTYIVENFVVANLNNFKNYSQSYINIDKIINNNEIKKITEECNCGYNFIPEVITTANIIYLYNTLDILAFRTDIPNYV